MKHFKFEPRGKWRIHKKPSSREIAACRPWLDAELAALAPDAVVLLGATAAQALLGPAARVGSQAHPVETSFAKFVVVTLHPAAVLRAGTEEARAAGRARLVRDLGAVARRIEQKGG